MKKNEIHVGSLSANVVVSTPTSNSDKRASAIGFAYGGAERIKMENNYVEVNGNIEATSELTSNTHTYATGFGFSNANMINNDVTVSGDIISNLKNSTTSNSSAFSSGLSVTSKGTVNSDIYVTGSIIAKSSRNAYANGLTAEESGLSELNKIEVNGNIEAVSSTSGYAGASGYADYVGSGTIQNNSVHVGHEITAKSNQNAIASGFVNVVEKNLGLENVYMTENIMRSEGSVLAETSASSLSDVALAGGFISQIGNGVDLENNGVYIKQELRAEAQNGSQKLVGDFIAQAEFTNAGTTKSIIKNNTLLTRKTNDDSEHYYHFIGQYDDNALPEINENFVTIISGKSRMAYQLGYDASEQRWDFADTKIVPLGKVRIENTVQRGPSFDYVLDSNLNELEILPTHDTTKLIADTTQFPINIQTSLDRIPHDAVDDHIGNAKVLYDIIGIQDALTDYKVNINPKEHVIVQTSKSNAFEDEEIAISYTLDNGYEVDSVEVKNDNDGSTVEIDESTLMFKMPESDVTVTVNPKSIDSKSIELYLPDKTVYIGDVFTLVPNQDLQKGASGWTWDATYLSATFNSPATFTALKKGITYVEYQLDTGEVAKSKVTILNRNTVRPIDTSDKMNIKYMILLIVLFLISFYGLRRKKDDFEK